MIYSAGKVNINMIAAIGRNGELGKDNQLLWNLPADLAYFKQVTMGHALLMGRKTHESIGRILPGRPNYVMTTNPDYAPAEGAKTVPDIQQAVWETALAGESGDLFIIGGAALYHLYLPQTELLFLTVVDADFPEADTFFPRTGIEERFDVVTEEHHPADAANPYAFTRKLMVAKKHPFGDVRALS